MVDGHSDVTGYYRGVGSAMSFTSSLLINGFVFYALLKLPSRYNFPRSEKVFLMSLAACGLGISFFVILPTMISVFGFVDEMHDYTWPSEFQPNHWCQAVGIIGIIFMTASSWFIALLSINRCVLITRGLRTSIISSRRILAVIQAIVWFTLTSFYVTMFILVDAEVGLPDFTKVPIVRSNVTERTDVQPCNNIGKVGRVILEPNLTLSVYHEDTTSHFHPKATFTTYDPFTAIACGPNWRQIPNYLYVAISMFFVIPVCCALVSYYLIVRIAYRQVRSIRSIRLRPSVGSEESSSQPAASLGRLTSPTRDFWLNHVTIAGGAIGLPDSSAENRRHSRKHSSRNPLRASSKFRSKSTKFFKRHKSSCSILMILFVFLSTWSTYIVYFVVESESYYLYVHEVMKANNTDSVSEWNTQFGRYASFFMTWLTVAGRNWSVVVFALLNRKFRYFMKQTFSSCAIRNCFVRRIKHFVKTRSNKVVPILPRVTSHRTLATQRSGLNSWGDFHGVAQRAQWAVTDRGP